MDCRVVLWLFAKQGVQLVRGFIGIYAVMTDRMERPIGQSMCFFIIVLDTVILWLLTSDFYISTSPSQIQEKKLTLECPSKETTYSLMSLQVQYIYFLFSSSSFYGYILEEKWLVSSKGELTLKSALNWNWLFAFLMHVPSSSIHPSLYYVTVAGLVVAGLVRNILRQGLAFAPPFFLSCTFSADTTKLSYFFSLSLSSRDHFSPSNQFHIHNIIFFFL